MLYILLIIIAIGVLLQSEDGKKILNSLSYIAMIVGGLIVLFYIFVAIYALFTSQWLSSAYDKWLGPLLGGLIIIASVGYYGNLFVKHIKEKIKDKQTGYLITVFILLVIIIISWVVVPLIFS